MSFSRALLVFAWPVSTLVLATTAAASPCPATNVIADPPDFVWTYHPADANNPVPYYSGIMEIGQETFSIGGYSLTTRAYGPPGQAKTIPGPTIRVVPGNKYVLRFHNRLPYQPLAPVVNDFKDPDVSNLHTHGLHISGEAPGDDVMRSFEGQRGGDFVYDISADHMGGTFWYHAHHHGSTFLQVAGGAFGLLLVNDGADGIPANVAAMAERQLAIAYLDPAAAGTGGDTLMSGTLPSSWTVNGKLNGNLCVPVNEWQHWRVLLADRDAMMKTLTVSGCEVKLLARDGVWRTVVPKTLASGSIGLTGASRADLAVRCSGDGSISVGNTTVASIHADGAGNTAPNPYAADGVSTWSIPRPTYLRDLRAVTDVHLESVNMGARTVNGSTFNPDVPTFTLQANAVQAWSINGAMRHPFHLHVYHFQTIGCGGDFEDGEYYDTVASNCNLRFDLNAATSSVYAGRAMMHCHVLDHEDQGAMGWNEVLGGINPPTFPADGNLATPYSEYYSLSASQPGTSLAVGSITVSTVSAGGGRKRGQAKIVVMDNVGNLVAGATVTGTFSGSFNETVTSSPTGVDGSTTVQTSTTQGGSITLTFCVASITHPALAPFAGNVCASL